MIPICNLTRQYRSLQPDVDAAVSRVLARGMFTLGAEVAAFEKEFASYLGARFAIGVGCGTDALTLAVRSLGLGKGDEVILPANSYPTVFGVALSGVTIRLADSNELGLLDISRLKRAVSNKTKAIIPVHLYGNPADLNALHDFILGVKQNIFVIEDAAQAHGAEVQISQSASAEKIWKKVGVVGDIGIFSFYPTKNLGAYGDGGMVVTNNPKTATVLRELRQYGEKTRYQSERVSGVSRLDELQAAILRVKLRQLDAWNRRRREITGYYARELEGTGDISLTAVKNHPSTKSCCHLFVIRTKKRDELKEFLEKKGTGSAIHYPVPIHLTPSFGYLGYKKGDFPIAEALSKEVLSLPLFPELTDTEASKVVQTVKAFFR